MVPPSIHPNGEHLEWERSGEPARVSAEDLEACSIRLAIACLMAGNWPSRGSRHKCAMGLAGLLLTSGMAVADARHLIRTIAEYLGDDEVEDRVACVDSTAGQLDAGERVAGASCLKEILPPEVLRSLLSWLAVDNGQDIVEEFNGEYAVVMVGGHTAKDVIQMPNYVRVLISSNHDWIVPASFEARRFVVLDVSDACMQDHAYFQAILAEMDAGGRAALLDFLMKYDLSGTNLHKLPRTYALLDQKILSMPPADRFWYAVLERGYLLHGDNGWRRDVPADALYDEFVAFTGKSGDRRKGDGTSFGMNLKRLCPGIAKTRRTVEEFIPNPAHPSDRDMKKVRRHVYVIPTLAKCRDAFDARAGGGFEWPTVEEDGDERF